MDSDTSGQFSGSAAQRRAAVDLARKKVLAAYDSSAYPKRAIYSGHNLDDNPKSTYPINNITTHYKDTPAPAQPNSESWKTYHSAWQNYYQKYYSEYYSNAARNYIAKEQLKAAREKAEEEEIASALKGLGNLASKSTDKKAGLSIEGGALDSSAPLDENAGIKDRLRQEIRKKATDSAKKSRRHRHLIPIIAGVVVVLLILFLQYNRLIFAPIMAYVSPGNAPATEIEALDPTITQTVSADPRLIIPKLNIDVPINFDIPLSDVMSAMNHGVAHYRISGASAYPGEIGNFIITGHSAGDVYSSNPYKYIFSGLERLEDGDLIYVNYNSVRYTYKVVSKQVIEPTNVSALVVQTDKPLITLVTCTPLGTSRYRLLVTGEQISPSYENASQSETPTVTVDEAEVLPANEPSFFEGIWNWLTGK
ncbi:MAG: class E sortase [Candidatus Saccharibacteria bacterium]|nr:class E sortase [Candidatus Saccharibacteria bacterium]